METYQMIADEQELKWFFDHVVYKPQINESYSMVFVCRYKKLTPEEKLTLGLTRGESEFLSTQSIRLRKIKDALHVDEEQSWTFKAFLKHVKRFNVDQGAYTTNTGDSIPSKALAIIFYVNPCDDIKVADHIVEQIMDTKTAIVKAMLNGKNITQNLQTYQMFGNLENNVKHLKATCKGTSYWLDYDIDVPAWFKKNKVQLGESEYYLEPYTEMVELLNKYFGKGNYVIIDTSGGYHVLIRTKAINQDPHNFCRDVQTIYDRMLLAGAEPYLDDKGNSKFECIINDSQIPGLPLPGTYQYNNPVVVLNKIDFE